jgi:putative transcriptional regulator
MSRKQSRMDQELLEMAEAQHRLGLLDGAALQKITVRHFDSSGLITAEPMSGEQIREVREREHLSQAVFASYLNVTTGFVSQLERGTKQANGPIRALLNVIRLHGLGAIMNAPQGFSERAG